jgi:hypothetical protein
MVDIKETRLTYSDFTGKAFTVETERERRFVLWEHAQYIPCWDINGIWVTSEWLETIGDDSQGYNFEPMHDKECRYMRVKPLLCNNALGVIKWHYALNNTKYEIYRGNTTADEFYSVFPAGYCVRKLVGYPGDESKLGGLPTFWEVAETIMINPKGTMPVDYLSENVATYFNLEGDRYQQYWSKAEFQPSRDRKYPPGKFLCLEHPDSRHWQEYIVRIHFEDRPDPFLILPNRHEFFPHAPCGACGGDHPTFSMWPSYPMWSHWPTYDGTDFTVLINATEEDAMQRATHSSAVSIGAWYGWLPESKDRWIPKRGSKWHFLFGVTDESDDDLLDLGRSWLYPSSITEVKGAEFLGYDMAQMSYIFRVSDETVNFTVTPDVIMKNPLFILRNWTGDEDVLVKLNNGIISRDSLRTGLTDGDLYIWIEERFDSQFNLTFG